VLVFGMTRIPIIIYLKETYSKVQLCVHLPFRIYRTRGWVYCHLFLIFNLVLVRPVESRVNGTYLKLINYRYIIKTFNMKVMQWGKICIIMKTKTQKYSRLNLWSTWFEYSLNYCLSWLEIFMVFLSLFWQVIR
jgi:hypothetical protein